MNLIYSNKVKYNRDQFCDKVRNISDKLNIDPNWLMYIMNFETANTMDHQITNQISGATGLIQFMPSTAARLGTSTADLVQMSNVEQLDSVYAYLRPYRDKMKSMVDTYLAVFFPAAIGKPDEYILQTSKLSAGLIARQNPVFDLTKDGMITKNEIEARMLSSVPS